ARSSRSSRAPASPRRPACASCSASRAERTAEEPRAREAVAPWAFGGLRDADPRPDKKLGLVASRAEVERRAVERQAVVLARDPERLAEPPRPGREEAGLV